ncbi:hypothetical protein OG317_27990 [Streptomyces sp. NBC_01167]|uniref:hypothetical protein n=1 Tax=Streptomyces sp. NBC_01167 TaxID=2903756 RepID=UPI003862E2F9|nr:hypothetical protein OG317_27990 [Streptomyces sp. NBC_01167]
MHQKPDTGAQRTQEGGQRLDLSVPQVAGSALAAIAAAVLASQLGVYGTIIGAGLVSVVATCGGSVFQHFFRRTGEQIRDVTVQTKPKGRQVPLPPADDATQMLRQVHRDEGREEFSAASTHGTRVRGWKRPLVAASVVFGVAMLGITGYEVASGSELGGGNGTTVGSAVRGGGSAGGGGGGGNPAPATSPSQSPDHDRDQRRSPEGETNTGPGGGRSQDSGTGRQGDDADTEPTSPDSSPSTGDDGTQSPTPTPTPTPTPSGSAPDPGAGAGTGADAGTDDAR